MKSKVDTSGITLILQLLLFLLVIIFLILSAWFDIMYYVTAITAGITLGVMSYNNHKYFKRKYLSYIYLIFGIVMIISGLGGLVNG